MAAVIQPDNFSFDLEGCGDHGWQHGLEPGFWLLSERLEGTAYGAGESPIERQFIAACLLFNMTVKPDFFSFECEPAQYAYADVFTQEKIERYRVDFLILGSSLLKGVNVVVECDGHDFHERTPVQAKRDRERDRRLQMLGYHVMRFTGSELFNASFCCACEVALLMIGKSNYADRYPFEHPKQAIERVLATHRAKAANHG